MMISSNILLKIIWERFQCIQFEECFTILMLRIIRKISLHKLTLFNHSAFSYKINEISRISRSYIVLNDF